MPTLRKSRLLCGLISFKPAQPCFEIVDTIAESRHLVLHDETEFDSDLQHRLGGARLGVFRKLHLSQPDQPASVYSTRPTAPRQGRYFSSSARHTINLRP